MNKTCFDKYRYREAKKFLADAVCISAGYRNYNEYDRTYRKPDGSLWAEYVRDLEGDEFDYSLQEKVVRLWE